MDAPLRLAVELPPAAARTQSLEPWWKTAVASADAGAGVVWFTGGPAPDDPADHDAACDACTMAAAAVAVVTSALLGVVSAVPVDRHPSVVARDVTTLDVLSTGRAALLLRWVGGARKKGSGERSAALPGGLAAVCEHLGEAVAVTRAVLQDDDPVFEGRYVHVAGAVNRPPPFRPGGPPLFVEVPAGVAGFARREPGVAFLLRQVVTAGAAVVCPDDPGEVASWRALVEDAAAALWTGRDPREVPAVVCRTTLGHPRDDWTAAGTSTRAGTAVGARLDAARAAGADGVVVRLRSGRRGDEGLDVETLDPGRIAREVAECFDPWRR